MSDRLEHPSFEGNLETRGGLELADLSAESVIVYYLDGTVKYMNPAAESLYGWPAMLTMGRHVRELAGQVDIVTHWSLLLQEGSWTGKLHRPLRAGGFVAVGLRQTVRCDGRGRPFDVVEYSCELRPEDFTDANILHATQSTAALCWELDVSDAWPFMHHISLFKSSNTLLDSPLPKNWVSELFSKIRIVNVNDRARDVLGIYLEQSEITGKSVGKFWPLDVQPILADLIVDLVMQPVEADPLVRQLKSNGRFKDPTVTASRSESHPGERILISVTGLADDDRSFWYLRASEARYRKLIHHLPIALLQVDARESGREFRNLKANGIYDLDAYLRQHPELIDAANEWVEVTEINDKAITLLGGTSATDFLGPVGFLFANAHETARRVMVARFNGQRNHTEVMKFHTFDGQVRDIRLSVTYPADTEKLDVTLLALEDITERLSTERQLRKLETDFAHAARISMLGEFATSIAHEVSQPLASMITNGETSLRWLARPNPNLVKVEQLLTRIVTNGHRASDIIHRIRAMASKQDPVRIALNLDELIEEALLFVRHDIDSNFITVRTKFGAIQPVIGDRISLQQVVVNLLMNSIQAVTQNDTNDRRIEITTSTKLGEVSFSIHDSGPGIIEIDLERIFDSFYSTKLGGMGIGLAICHSIVTAHHGTITVRNHPGGGAYFKFTLPVSET